MMKIPDFSRFFKIKPSQTQPGQAPPVLKMPDFSKWKVKWDRKRAIWVLTPVLLFAYLVHSNSKLHSRLKSATQITQNLRQEVETLRQENGVFVDREKTERSQLENLSAELTQLRQDKSLSAGRQEELKKLVTAAEKTLDAQNRKISQLESTLKEADERMRRSRKASLNLEQQTKSAKANAGMTPEYVKIVENEWMAAVNKTEETQRDLDRTLAELSGQNQERSKLRHETATMHYNLAVILTEQQNFPAAIREYLQVLEIRPNDADAHYNLAIIYDDYLKNTEKAVEHYRRYVKIAPDAPEAQKVRQWIKEKEFDNTFKFKL